MVEKYTIEPPLPPTVKQEDLIDIHFPYNFIPRFYQIPVWNALEEGFRRLIWIAHRRAGKDKTIFNWVICQCVKSRITAYYCLPEYAQGRRVIWDNIDNSGIGMMSHIPSEVIQSVSQQEMKLTFRNGSILQIVGADNYDRLVGSNPRIVVFSEYAITNPRAWEFIKPIVDNPESKGVAIFVSTPRGKNHFYDLYKMALQYPDEWYCRRTTIEETKLITEKDIEKIRREGMSEELIQQEYYTSFSMGQEGSYYSRYLGQMEIDGRIGDVPYDPNHLVYTAWDLGIGDSMSIVWFQVLPSGIVRVIDHYENKGYALKHYCAEITGRPYQYGAHFVPHDGSHRDMITGSTFIDNAALLGIRMTMIPNDTKVMEGIEIVRGLLPMVCIDNVKCSHLLKCLLNYHAEYSEKNQVQNISPAHNWASHSSDSFRYMALAIRKGMTSNAHSQEWGAIKSKIGYYDNNTLKSRPNYASAGPHQGRL